jgi:hypothetical protein
LHIIYVKYSPSTNTYFVTEINLIGSIGKKKDFAYLRAVETALGTPSTVCLTYLKRKKNITLVLTRTFGQRAGRAPIAT